MSDKKAEYTTGTTFSGNRFLDRRTDRRSLLKGTLKLVTGVAVGRVVGREELPEDKSRNAAPKNLALADVGNSSNSFNSNQGEQNRRLETKEIKQSLFESVFGGLPQKDKEEVRRKVEEMKLSIGKLEDYDLMQGFQKSYGDRVSEIAKKYRLLPQTLFGMILIESGGDGTLISEADAKGIAQIVDETARVYSEKYSKVYKEDINANGDFRENPYLSTIVMAMYESDLKRIFGENDGLAILAYNWGEGTMMEALRIYFKNTTGADIGDYHSTLSDRSDVRRLAIEDAADQLIIATKLNVHQLLSNPVVQREVVSRLRKPEGSIYVYKAVAAAELFEN